ncbi:MAG: GAF domain-containing protein [Leptospiraceae bacterium]|nr:GAF domain-containing protein [Leptospiraceae bacterium]
MVAHVYLDPALSRITLETFRDPVHFATINDNLAIKAQDADEEHAVIWLLTSSSLTENAQLIANWLQKYPQHRSRIIVLGDHEVAESRFMPLGEEHIHLHLPSGVNMVQLRRAIETQINALHAEFDRLNLQEKLANSYIEIRRLTAVGQALATERDFDRLIELVLNSAIELTSADGGSIYLSEKHGQGDKPTHIRFKKSAMQLDASEFLLPIDKKSIAGYVALTVEPLLIDDVHNLPVDAGYTYNSEYDKAHNYYTKSMMVIPMKNHHEEVIGIIQLINRKRDPDLKLTLEDLKGNAIISFTRKDYSLVSAMAGQAAVAIENNQLLQDIQNLFEGFVKASVTAIEQRDPTTSGHSFRVADYSVNIAMAVNRDTGNRFSSVRFSRNQIQELRYASLLHDFGKVGVREDVLVKAKKLYPSQLELIRWRFHYIRKDIETTLLKKRLDEMQQSPREKWPEIEAKFRADLEKNFAEVDEMFSAILSANEPTVLAAGSFDFLRKIAENRVRVSHDHDIPYLSEQELVMLSIRKGTLDERERLEIESHVTHTYNFLKQIPWTPNLRWVPEIAYGHHEKLNGGGYPLKRRDPEISLQTRMMTIADIYDALTAWDRPYKKAIPPEKAIDILQMEVKDGHVDPDLLKIFIDAKVFARIDELRAVESR